MMDLLLSVALVNTALPLLSLAVLLVFLELVVADSMVSLHPLMEQLKPPPLRSSPLVLSLVPLAWLVDLDIPAFLLSLSQLRILWLPKSPTI
jgi:hypothetical protein